MSSPGGKPLFGRLESYLYQMNGEIPVKFQQKLVDNDQVPAISVGEDRHIKYCFNPPLLSRKCNTLNHRLKKINSRTLVFISTLADPSVFSLEENLFEKDAMFENTNDSGSGLVIVTQVGENVLVSERTIFHSIEQATIDDFKIF